MKPIKDRQISAIKDRQLSALSVLHGKQTAMVIIELSALLRECLVDYVGKREVHQATAAGRPEANPHKHQHQL